MSGLYGVLVVDDEMLIRQGIINYLDWEQEGFQIVGEAANGNEALDLIEKVHPHLILTDVVMPGMDGLELIKIVKENYPSIEIVALSSFENYDYVRSTFQSGVADYILKPKLNSEELIKTLRKVMPDVSDSHAVAPSSITMEEALKKMVSGYTLNDKEKEKVKEFSYSQFSLAAVFGMPHQDGRAFFEEISNQLTDQVEEMECRFISQEISDATVMLLNFEPAKLEAIKQAINYLATQDRETGAAGSWVMSGPFISLEELRIIYEEELVKMIDYLFYLPDEPVLMYDALPETPKISRHFDLSQFIASFEQKKFQTAIQSLTEHIELLTQDYTKDIFEFKSWLENIIFNTTVLLGNMGYDTEELEAAKYDYFADINEARHAHEAVSRFHDFVEAVQELVLAKDEKRYPPNMQRLLRYIEIHYAEPLSLTTLAAHFHFNPSYLSSYFSTHHKSGFSEYLNQVRVDKAKRFLDSTTDSIASVSERVGYSEPSYFCRIFKRIEGSSPGNYRKERMNSKARGDHEETSADYSK